jgi:pyruvate dehydrogenase E1 component alpha subunit
VNTQQLDKAAKAEVDEAVEEAKASPEPLDKDLWVDIYYKGTEPPSMRGREREEVCCLVSLRSQLIQR